jgi:hypothetical protein
METWGSRWLNLARRVVLIKYVLSNLPIYQFSTLLAPKGILKELAQFIHKFLWQGGKASHKKFHLLNWDTVTLPKKSGGLGIRDPEITNSAMVAKLLWRLVIGDNDQWKMALIKKYSLDKRTRSNGQTPNAANRLPNQEINKGHNPLFQRASILDPGKWKINQNLARPNFWGGINPWEARALRVKKMDVGHKKMHHVMISQPGTRMAAGRIGIWEECMSTY